MAPSSTARSRYVPPAVTVALAVVGVALVAIGIVYFTHTAGALPAAFPGHLAHSAHKHTKHGVVAVALGAICLLAAWLSTGTRRA